MGRRWVHILAALLIVGSGFLIKSLQARQRLGEPGVKVVAVPIETEEGDRISDRRVGLPEVAGYESKAGRIQTLVHDWLPKDTTYGRRLYRSPQDGFMIDCNVVLMGADRTSIHQPQYCLPGGGWRIVEDAADEIRIGSGRLPVKRIVARRSVMGDRGPMEFSVVLVYCFVTKGQVTADHGARMWQQAVEQLTTGVLQRWAYVACYAFCEGGKEDVAYRRVAQFLSRAAPEFMDVPGRD